MNDPLAPFEPGPRDPWDLRKVGHLLRRAGFGASLPVRRELVRAGPDAALDHVAPPTADPLPPADLLAAAIATGAIERVRAFRVYWALQSPHPLAARMAVFWHGHFATSNQKLLDPRAMAQQQLLFDRLGLGRFDELLVALCHDPALLRWLDNDTNTVAKPNENFARELLELFTLGRGNYGESDVREAARAFSGYHVRDGVFTFVPHQHDAGAKVVCGVRGDFDGDGIAALLAARPESARFLATRWLQHFVHPEPAPAEVAALVEVYERADRHIGTTLRTLLRSRLFFSPRAYRCKVKSPADFVLGTVAQLGGRAAPADLARVMQSLGETWLEPPSVEGWHGERAWLSPAAWLLRSNFTADLLAQRRHRLQGAPVGLFAGLSSPADRAKAAALVLLDGDVSGAGRARLEAVAAAAAGNPAQDAAELLHAAACLPEYQLL